MNPTVGRIVHYRLPTGHRFEGQVRPAIVVSVVPGGARRDREAEPAHLVVAAPQLTLLLP